MTKEEKIQLVESRIRFLSVWKEISNRRKAFAPMIKIFKLLEADYSKCIIPDEKEMVYRHFKDESFERIVPIKLGKYLVKNYKDLVPADHILTDFVAMLNAIIWKKPPSIVVYKGEDLITAYKRCNDSKKVGSCMSREGRHTYMELLAKNPDKVEIHCYEDAEDIYARVLVWKLKSGKNIVDRIYPNNGDNFHTMLEHFKGLKNYHIRSNHDPVDDKDGYKVVEIDGIVSPYIILDSTGVENYPYFDTMRYGAKIGDNEILLTNTLCSDPLTNLAFDSPSGGSPTEFEENV